LDNTSSLTTFTKIFYLLTIRTGLSRERDRVVQTTLYVSDLFYHADEDPH